MLKWLLLCSTLLVLVATPGRSHAGLDVTAAIAKARGRLLQLQHQDGHWAGHIHVNPRETAYSIITIAYLRVPGMEGDIARSAQWLIGHVNSDHGWGFFDKGGTSDVSITAIAHLALRLAGTDANSPIMREAAVFIENNGGLIGTDIFCKTFYALFDLFPAPWEDAKSAVFFPPLETLYARASDEGSVFRLMAWGREAAIAMSVIKEYKKRDSLALKSAVLAEAERWIVSHQLEDGCWYTLLGTSLNMIALGEINREKHWPRILHGMSWINRMRDADGYQRRFELSVWDTALAVKALRDAHAAPSSLQLLRAGDWLVHAQTMGGGSNWSNVPSGGWSYNQFNILYPDNDDTALALTALQSIRFRSYSNEYRKRMSVKQGEMWLLYMQNHDGGWATFDQTDKEKDYGLPPSAIEDPSVADVTGHVLTALGANHTSRDPPVARAIEYLKKDQNSQGAWYGRWGLCYLYGTSAVLVGLKDVGFDMGQPFVQKAVRWLRDRQNDDGGWGEYFFRWDNERGISYTQFGHSNPEQTAWGVLALLSTGTKDDQEAAEQGIRYLLATQEEDGGWTNPEYTVLGLNPYRNTLYPIYFPVRALAAHAATKTAAVAHDDLDSETFRMIEDLALQPDPDEWDSKYLRMPSFQIEARPVEGNSYRVSVYNSSSAKVAALVLELVDGGANSVLESWRFDALEAKGTLSRVVRLPEDGRSTFPLRVRVAYRYRGEEHSLEEPLPLARAARASRLPSLRQVLAAGPLLILLLVAGIILRTTRREFVWYSLKNLLRNRLRSSLSFLGIVMGIAATAGTISLGLSFKSKLKSDFEAFGAGRIIVLPARVRISVEPPIQNVNMVPPLRLASEVIDEVKKLENVKDVSSVVNYESSVTYRGQAVSCFIQFVDARAFRHTSSSGIAEGAFLDEDDLLSANVGHSVAQKAFSSKVDLGSILKIGNYEFKVKGIFAETKGMDGKIESIITPNIVIFLPLRMSNRFVMKDHFDALEVKVIDSDQIEDTDRQINQVLRDRHPNTVFSTVYAAKLERAVAGLLDQFNTIMLLMGAFCLLVSGIGVANMMLVAVHERRTEIGVLRALGATKPVIVRMFLLELGALGFLSGLAGSAGGMAILLTIQSIAKLNSPPAVSILLGTSIFIGVIVVVLFGIVPVLKQLKMEPIESINAV